MLHDLDGTELRSGDCIVLTERDNVLYRIDCFHQHLSDDIGNVVVGLPWIPGSIGLMPARRIKLACRKITCTRCPKAFECLTRGVIKDVPTR